MHNWVKCVTKQMNRRTNEWMKEISPPRMLRKISESPCPLKNGSSRNPLCLLLFSTSLSLLSHSYSYSNTFEDPPSLKCFLWPHISIFCISLSLWSLHSQAVQNIRDKLFQLPYFPFILYNESYAIFKHTER